MPEAEINSYVIQELRMEFWRRSQESHLVINHVEFIDYFPMRFTDMPPIMPPHVFLNDQLADL